MDDYSDDNGELRKHVEYGSFGNITGEAFRDASGNFISATDPEAVDQLFYYTGQEFDQATGLQNNNARWYDGRAGRFLSEDPIAADVNLYRYALNNPVLYVDPSGLYTALPTSYLPALGSTHSAKPFSTVSYATPSFGVPTADESLRQLNTTLKPFDYYNNLAAPAHSVLRQPAPSLAVPLRDNRNYQNFTGLSAQELVNGYTNEELLAGIGERVRREANAEADAARYSTIRAVTQEEFEESRYRALKRDAIHTREEQGFINQYEAVAIWNDPFARMELGINIAAGFAGGYTPQGTPLSARQPIVPITQRTAPSNSLNILNREFTPNGSRVLQNLTNQVNTEFIANPRLATTVLSDAELRATIIPGVARLQYGNAVERLVAERIAKDPLGLGSIFEHNVGERGPDFFGRGDLQGQIYDITTPGQVPAHLARPYGQGLNTILYQRPAGFP